MSNDGQDEEMICALTADEYVALKNGLRELPETMPPRDVWSRIREQAEAEGLFTKPVQRKQTRWYVGVGFAAAAVLAAVMMSGGLDSNDGIVVPTGSPTNSYDGLRALMVRSQQLESDLRALPAEPRVARAGTVATISDIENRIAAIDYQLNDHEFQMSSDDREIFWRERVRLMNLLLQLRYAQAQRAAY